MSAQDEVSTVVKCLRLGAADYLVKPLRTNELLNLWTHMWRRRHMVCLHDFLCSFFHSDSITTSFSSQSFPCFMMYSNNLEIRETVIHRHISDASKLKVTIIYELMLF